MSFDDGEGIDYTALERLEFERPRSWIQYSDGTWEPVWADGSVGDPDTVSNLVQAIHGNRESCRVVDLRWVK